MRDDFDLKLTLRRQLWFGIGKLDYITGTRPHLHKIMGSGPAKKNFVTNNTVKCMSIQYCYCMTIIL